MPTLIQNRENLKKKAAIELRKRGFSYSDIQKSVPVPRSTLSHWLKSIKLSDSQKKNLLERRSKIAKKNSEKKVLKTLETIEHIKASSAKDINKISKRELWLMGIALYWRQRYILENPNDIKNGVRLMSSDPALIKFFLLWLHDIGGIKNNEIAFDLFIKENYKNQLNRIIHYWSGGIGIPKIYFSQIYYQKNIALPHKNGRNLGDVHYNGILRIRVRSSSMLARQIAGWIKGIESYYWGTELKIEPEDYT